MCGRNGFRFKSGSDFFHQRVRGDAMFFAQDRNAAVFDELVGPANAHHRRVDLVAVQMLHHGAAKSIVQNVIFDRANHFDAAREKFERAGIDRFDPARIDQRDGNALLLQFLRRFLGDFEHVAESENRDIASVLHDFGFADFEQTSVSSFGFAPVPAPRG